MSRKARSARGEVVDFDLIAIREQIAAKPPSIEVDIRRKYIDTKEKVKQVIKAVPIIAPSGKKETTPTSKTETSKEKPDGTTTTS